LYISTAGGGSWRTENGGKTWTPLFDSLSTVQRLTIQGADPLTDTFTLKYTDPFTGIQTRPPRFLTTSPTISSRRPSTKSSASATRCWSARTTSANGINEVQQIELNTATTNWQAGITRFTLNFKGRNTQQITYTGVPGTDALNIQNALNSLSTIGGLSPNPGVVRVSVIAPPPAGDEIFNIIFQGGLASKAQPLITFNIGGPGGNFWGFGQPPIPFPTINSVPATGNPLPNRDRGPLLDSRRAPDRISSTPVTFSGGKPRRRQRGALAIHHHRGHRDRHGVAGVDVTTPPDSGGAGYTSPPSVTFTGGGGAGATGVATIVGGISGANHHQRRTSSGRSPAPFHS